MLHASRELPVVLTYAKAVNQVIVVKSGRRLRLAKGCIRHRPAEISAARPKVLRTCVEQVAIRCEVPVRIGPRTHDGVRNTPARAVDCGWRAQYVPRNVSLQRRLPVAEQIVR